MRFVALLFAFNLLGAAIGQDLKHDVSIRSIRETIEGIVYHVYVHVENTSSTKIPVDGITVRFAVNKQAQVHQNELIPDGNVGSSGRIPYVVENGNLRLDKGSKDSNVFILTNRVVLHPGNQHTYGLQYIVDPSYVDAFEGGMNEAISVEFASQAENLVRAEAAEWQASQKQEKDARQEEVIRKAWLEARLEEKLEAETRRAEEAKWDALLDPAKDEVAQVQRVKDVNDTQKESSRGFLDMLFPGYLIVAVIGLIFERMYRNKIRPGWLRYYWFFLVFLLVALSILLFVPVPINVFMIVAAAVVWVVVGALMVISSILPWKASSILGGPISPQHESSTVDFEMDDSPQHPHKES
ncbi:MAG: hypothetical protein MKZ59_01330 [Deinococcales bacterium]|nr:hypothetical protein [Deinococcales bacterium]